MRDEKYMAQMRRGSTDILLLAMLTDQQPKYGRQIQLHVQERSGGFFRVDDGLLYPTLHRLEDALLLTAEWRIEEDGRRRKYYTITNAGSERLHQIVHDWQTFTEKLLETIEPPETK